MKRVLAAALAAGLFAAGPGQAAPAPLMQVLITPGAMSQAAGKGDVDVAITVPAMDVAAGAPLFALPAMAPGMPSAQPVTNLTVTDAAGPVDVVAGRADGATQWTSNRHVSGDVVIRYRLPIDNSRGSSPPINLRIDGDGFSSPGRMLLALPKTKTPYRTAIRWDVSAMGPGAIGVSSYGDGDVEVPAGPVDRLSYVFFIAGHLTRYPADSKTPFAAVWLGEPTFDPVPSMQWTAKLHHWMSGFFGDTTEPPYRVILRGNPQNPGGGVAMLHSFAVGYGAGTTGEGLKSILGHEMTHTWTANEGLGKWWSEGDAVYYQALLSWRAGLISTDQYLTDLNRTASRYYTNAMMHTPEAEVLPHFWEDTRIRVLPYDRGAMYFAVLNGKVRKASGGKRSIDDLIRTMMRKQSAGQPTTEAVWMNLLRKEIGPEGPAIHTSMMAGGLMLPESDGFGPCFRRITKPVRQFDQGFDNKSMIGSDKRIQGLDPNSEAAKAGVLEGDKVIDGGAGDVIQADPTRTMTIRVMRDGQPVAITYLPRGKVIDAYQWERIPGVPESACK